MMVSHAQETRAATSPQPAAPTGSRQPPFLRLERQDREAVWRRRRYWVWVLLVFAAIGTLVPFERSSVVACGMKRLTGLPCPFCGATTTFRLLIQGYWAEAVTFSPFMAAAYVALAVYLAYALAATATGWGVAAAWDRRRIWIAAGILLALGAVSYAYRIWMTVTGGFPCLPWDPAAPTW